MAYRLRYCTVHDSLWAYGDLCEDVIIGRELAGKYDNETCQFIYLKAERD